MRWLTLVLHGFIFPQSSESRRVPYVGQEMLTPFGEFMVSPSHCKYELLNLSVLGLCLRINDWFVCLDWSDCIWNDRTVSLDVLMGNSVVGM